MSNGKTGRNDMAGERVPLLTSCGHRKSSIIGSGLPIFATAVRLSMVVSVDVAQPLSR